MADDGGSEAAAAMEGVIQFLSKNKLIVGTVVFGLVIQLILQLTKPPKKIDVKSFENLIDDAGGEEWAEEEEKEEDTPATAASGASAEAKAKNLPAKKPTVVQPKKPRKKKVNEGPYNIGERVVLKNLVSAKHLNGRHGIIADVWNKKTERYPIDLDLFDPNPKNNLPTSSSATGAKNTSGTVAVKACNIEKEGKIPEDIFRAPISNGCLEEAHARAYSFVFSSLRNSVSSSLRNEKDMNKVAHFGWAFWKNGPPMPNGKNGERSPGVYPSLSKFLTTDILNRTDVDKLNEQINPSNPKDAYKLVQDAVMDKRAVGGWNVRVHGTFYIAGMSPAGTLVIPVNNTRAVYCVLGIRMPLGATAMGRYPRPPKLNLTLVPWYGRIVHDPLIVTSTGTNQVELASPKVSEELTESVALAKEEGRIIDRFYQLDAEGGSDEGLNILPVPPMMPPGAAGGPMMGGPGGPMMGGPGGPMMGGPGGPMMGGPGGPMMGGPGGPPPPKQEPATSEELSLVDNLMDFDPFPVGPQGQPTTPQAAWNFIRKGQTKEENPNLEGIVVSANGQTLCPLKLSDVEPSTIDILKTLTSLCVKMGKRPNIVGVDEQKCCYRLQFLLKDVKDLRVLGLNVKRKTGPPPGGAGGGGAAASGGGGGAVPAPE